MATIVAVLHKAKETTNKVQFKEGDTTDGEVETLYLRKAVVRNDLGGAETITVLVEAGDQTEKS